MTTCGQLEKYVIIERGRVWLKVDHQTFQLAYETESDEPELFAWYRDQLLIALERMVNQVKGGG